MPVVLTASQIPFYDAPAVLDARAERVRQDWVKTMEARIVREELQKCRKAEGINSYYYCKPLVETYLGLLREAKVSVREMLKSGRQGC